ncbi:MAG: 50S ribosomal protein L10 [Clostridia bacterium]|nr:50S ribosomal protein L10 [Clostridia bacterium]MBQ6245210.1 50S ribosomal protein L10 [Bacteroidales bacterium]MBR4457427.1 50S ribosomal protein L10 [Clostridia bacterium]
MSKNRELKEQVVSEIVEKVKGAESIAVVSYSGLTVEQVTNLRKQCREKDVQYCVLKNRLVKLALNEVGIEGVDDLLNGPNAFVFSMKDAVSGPKVISDFIEKNKLQSLKMTGGVFEGKVADEKTMQTLAKMPGREELLATLVGCLQSPISGLVAVLDQIAEKKEAA